MQNRKIYQGIKAEETKSANFGKNHFLIVNISFANINNQKMQY